MADCDIEPGIPEAVDQGCICQPIDGEAIVKPRWPDWLTKGGPLHDPNLDGCIGGNGSLLSN